VQLGNEGKEGRKLALPITFGASRLISIGSVYSAMDAWPSKKAENGRRGIVRGVGLGTGLGMALGAALGVVMQNIPVGIAIGTGAGIAIGVSVGTAIDVIARSKTD
jgi:hypothetical protein